MLIGPYVMVHHIFTINPPKNNIIFIIFFLFKTTLFFGGSTLRICLGSTNFAEIENFLLKVL